MNTTNIIKRARGRPRGFDTREALETAMRSFWANGYDGTSMDTLSRKTHMPRASIYQDYGDKEGLFLASIEHYAQTRSAHVGSRLEGGGDLRSDLDSYLAGVVELATGDPKTPGCLVTCVLADAAGSNLRLREELDRRFSGMEARIAARMSQAQATGELPEATDVETLAVVLAATARGLMVRARAGAPAEMLHRAAKATVEIILR
jgi:TetR/AcrR family transcriptional repressor of nem operon